MHFRYARYYYITAYGATKLRRDFKQRALVRHLVNFNELKIFESAQGQHNMITILQKGQDENAVAKTAITQKQGVAKQETLRQILSGNDPETPYYQVKQKDLYDGDDYQIRLQGTSIEGHDPIQTILSKIKTHGDLLGVICNVNQGIVTGADKVSKKHIEKYGIKASVGDGIFILSKREIVDLKLSADEKKLLRPWFKNSDILRWTASKDTKKEVIYSNDETVSDIEDLPNLERHLAKFKKIISAYAYRWHDLHRSRQLKIFEGPKIVVPQRSPLNTFGYNEIPWYASADVYFITTKNKEISLKYILALLNSQLYYLWLYYQGKRKGEILELYQAPLSEIPIKKILENEQKSFINLVDKILALTKDNDYLKNSEKQAKVHDYEKQVDQLVYKLYSLTPEEIEVVEKKDGRP
ncbi:MAG: TaqI-like C-terminal specificity domain-containing protein [bacterium]|nr:TaqI-like C-terminal specificity domain-containing protein [bacterium]